MRADCHLVQPVHSRWAGLHLTRSIFPQPPIRSTLQVGAVLKWPGSRLFLWLARLRLQCYLIISTQTQTHSGMHLCVFLSTTHNLELRFHSSFLLNKSDICTISAKYNCNSQVFPLNGVQRTSRNFTKISSRGISEKSVCFLCLCLLSVKNPRIPQFCFLLHTLYVSSCTSMQFLFSKQKQYQQEQVQLPRLNLLYLKKTC